MDAISVLSKANCLICETDYFNYNNSSSYIVKGEKPTEPLFSRFACPTYYSQRICLQDPWFCLLAKRFQLCFKCASHSTKYERDDRSIHIACGTLFCPNSLSKCRFECFQVKPRYYLCVSFRKQ